MNEENITINVEGNLPEFNPPDGGLPFFLAHPEQDGRLVWICSTDEDSRITSMYMFRHPNGKLDKDIAYLPSLEEAKRFSSVLRDEGWIPARPPSIEIRDSDGKVISSIQ